MMIELIKRHFPEWIEAGVIVGTLVIGAVVSAGITFYKVDLMSEDVKDIKTAVSAIPVLVQRMDTIEKRLDDAEKQMDKLDDRVYHLKEGSDAKEGSI